VARLRRATRASAAMPMQTLGFATVQFAGLRRSPAA